jgi:hypothetical protein
MGFARQGPLLPPVPGLALRAEMVAGGNFTENPTLGIPVPDLSAPWPVLTIGAVSASAGLSAPTATPSHAEETLAGGIVTDSEALDIPSPGILAEAVLV